MFEARAVGAWAVVVGLIGTGCAGEEPAAPGAAVAASAQALTAADCPAGYTIKQGTSASETLTGTQGNDCLVGLGGNDTLNGLGGNDFLIGGNGDDQLYGGDGNDTLHGEAGSDRLEGGDGNDSLFGGTNPDTLLGQAGDDTVAGDAANDTIEGGPGRDVLRGGDATDTIRGGDDDDRIFGDGGGDELMGDSGDDVIAGGAQGDSIWGGDGDDAIHGGDGNDTLNGDAGDDAIIGGLGTNPTNGGAGTDACSGTSCEKPALVPNGCVQNSQCAAGTVCLADIGLCLGCVADNDGDAVCNSDDGCPSDPNKSASGACGCGVSDADSDTDGTPNCTDGCPADPAKIAAGICGCGVSDADSDADGAANCNDGCPADPAKIAAGICGCGVSDTDSDADGAANCNDGCPADPAKVAAGICGCAVSDADSDADGAANCNDGCPADPAKIAAGICGCGVSDTDSDADGTANCNDACASDPGKTAPGICGCGVSDADSDADGAANCNDGCPADPAKVAPGSCGCGLSDTDTDGDGQADCVDSCPIDSPDDTDADGVCDSIDECPGFDDLEDTDDNGVPDGCQECFSVADCEDGNECTIDACSVATGQCSVTPVPAQTELVNADFETGDLTGFTTYTTPNGAATITVGSSPRRVRLVVGEAVSAPTGTEGGGIVQSVQLGAGSLSVTVMVGMTATASNGDGGTMALYVDGTLLESFAFGSAQSGTTRLLYLTGTVPSIAAGSHAIRVEARRAFAPTSSVVNLIDDLVISGSAVQPPVLCAGGTGICDGAGTCTVCNDADQDGVCDELDICPGFDDAVDPDGDGMPTGCDTCPLDAGPNNDTDNDGTCNAADQCPGFRDSRDDDLNGVPDCDQCATAADCDDSDGCTGDVCTNGRCDHAAAPAGTSCGWTGGTCNGLGDCVNTTCKIVGLGDMPGGAHDSVAYAVSDDGTTVTGRALLTSGAFAAFRWTAATGMVGLPATSPTSGRAISADGSVIAGIAGSETTLFQRRAFRTHPDFVETTFTGNTVATGITADGSVVVGTQDTQAFYWIDGSSPVSLGLSSSNAVGISGDGYIIAGNGIVPLQSGVQAFVRIGTVVWGLGTGSTARAISSNGRFVVGMDAGGAFDWTETQGRMVLPTILEPNAVADDGTVAGVNRQGSPVAYLSRSPIGSGGLRVLLGTTCGINVTGWSFTEANDITKDASTVVGLAINPSGKREAFLARLY